MIGDSISDYEASEQNNIQFILRKTEFNKITKAVKMHNDKNFNYE